MRNDELYSPTCPDEHAKKLVLSYALRGLLDDRRCYTDEKLLAAQCKIYEEWLAAVRESCSGFDCDFYEWLSRGGSSGDAAFIFKPGDLVKYNGRYCVVVRRETRNMGYVNSWRVRNGKPVQRTWPQPACAVELKDPDGHVHTMNALSAGIEPADIPPEVFALACGRAKNCPMVKGDAE